MSLYYCLVPKMANAVVLWVIVYFCVTSVNTKAISSRVLNLRTEHEEIQRRCIGKLLKRRIERHLELL